MITIVDLGLGNVGSISNILNRLGAESIITNKKEDLVKASKLILPGVGSFDTAINNLRENGLIESLHTSLVEQKTPILGICLGAQLLTKCSEEGNHKGLGYVNLNTIKFKLEDKSLKLPNMGWRKIIPRNQSKLFDNIEDPWFYFVHNYHFNGNEPNLVSSSSEYGKEFISSFEKENILGVQFHPEKSHKYGFKLFENFLKFYS